MTERGIILAPDIRINTESNSIELKSSEPNPSLLRQAILYWDKIDFPQNNLLHINSNDIDFLEQEGIAQKTQVTIPSSGELASLYCQAQFAAFEHLEEQNPGMWTMGQYSTEFINPSTNTVESQVIELIITNALPVPPDNVPLDDILTFRQKRKDELKRLRIAIDELCDKALKWKQIPRGKNAAVLELTNIIKAIQAVANETWVDKCRSSIKLYFNLSGVVKGAAVGLLSHHLGLNNSISIPEFNS